MVCRDNHELLSRGHALRKYNVSSKRNFHKLFNSSFSSVSFSSFAFAFSPPQHEIISIEHLYSPMLFEVSDMQLVGCTKPNFSNRILEALHLLQCGRYLRLYICHSVARIWAQIPASRLYICQMVVHIVYIYTGAVVWAACTGPQSWDQVQLCVCAALTGALNGAQVQ